MGQWIFNTDEGEVSDPTLSVIRHALKLLESGRSPGGLSLSDANDDALLIASFDNSNSLGYFVNVREHDDIAEQVLVDRSLGEATVQGNIGGQLDERPRFVFVGRDIAERAVDTFYKTGKRDVALSWLPFEQST